MVQNAIKPTKSLFCAPDVQNRYKVEQSKDKNGKLISILFQLIALKAPFEYVDNSCFNYFPSTQICWHWLRNEHRIIYFGCLLPFSSISIKFTALIAHILKVDVNVFDERNIFNCCLAQNKFCHCFLFIFLICL